MASKKKVATKRQVWNKGLEVGKRDAFTPAQVKRIRGLLADRGIPGLRDLALFSMAVDTMLHGQDLLRLVVGDVQRRNGSIRPVIEVGREGKATGAMRLVQSIRKGACKMDRLVRQKAYRLFIPWQGLGQSSNERAAIEPSVEVVGGRGRARSHGLRRRLIKTDEGSPHFERHWGFAGGSSALGPCENREHSEISRS